MEIAIISDTHNNMANFKKAIEWIKKENIQLILHCGDISSQETIDEAQKFFGDEADVKFVKGNGDFGLNLPEKLELEIEGKHIAFTHFPGVAKELAQSGKFDVVFYGHTHKPWQEKIGVPAGGLCQLINPGELAGQYNKSTFAVYDMSTGELQLKILEKL